MRQGESARPHGAKNGGTSEQPLMDRSRGAGMAQPIIPPTWARLVGLIDQLEEMEEGTWEKAGKKAMFFRIIARNA